MKVDFSKDFTKAIDKLTGKVHHSIVDAINNVIDAQCILFIGDAKRFISLSI